MQEKQMNLHIRFWDAHLQQGITRYYGSEFLGHAKADLVSHFKEVLCELDMKDLIQISMDIKFHEIMQNVIRQEYAHSLIDIGSCGLQGLIARLLQVRWLFFPILNLLTMKAL